MAKFVKLTQLLEDGSYLRTWIPIENIGVLSQNSVTQEGENRGSCTLIDGQLLQLIAFNETLDSLK